MVPTVVPSVRETINGNEALLLAMAGRREDPLSVQRTDEPRSVEQRGLLANGRTTALFNVALENWPVRTTRAGNGIPEQ